MAATPITRRSLLGAGAGALAAAALRPALALAEPGTRLRSIALGTLRGVRRLELPRGAAVVALQWSGSTGAAPELRALLAGGSWGPWVAAGEHGHAPEGAPSSSRSGDPLWVGGARLLELRSSSSLRGARLCVVTDAQAATPPRGPGFARAAALALAQPVLAAGAGQPPIIARSVWAQGVPPPRVAPAYGEVKLGFVHHTENPNGYSAAQVPAMLRAIYLFHREGNGWNDIGYNFVIDLFGRVWEGRAGGIDEPVVGAQAGGYNIVSSGVAVLGSFMGTPISPAARSALQRLLAWKLSLHGTPSRGHVTVRVDPAGAVYSKYPARARVSLPRIAGHRDADTTDCPGDVLYGQLGAVRSSVQALTASAVLATLGPLPGAAPAAPEGSAPAAPAAPPQLLVTLARLDGTPLAGVPVQLQARSVARRGLSVTHTTVAEGVTDATGRCAIAAAFAVGARAPLWVRALYAGGPAGGAAVSPAVEVQPLAPPAAPAPAPAPAPATGAGG